jgi:hypothetical protein
LGEFVNEQEHEIPTCPTSPSKIFEPDETSNCSTSLLITDPQARPVPATSNAQKAGTLLGLHNAFIVLPQLLASVTGSLVFRHWGEGSEAIGLIWRIGGVFALVAAFLCVVLNRQ